jgi:hypothetical protein
MLLTSGSGGGLSPFSYSLDTVIESDEDHLRQLGMAIEPASAFLCGLREFEDQGQRRLIREAALAANRAMAHRAEVLSNLNP